MFDDKKRLSPQVVDAYLGELWKRGWLEDADPDFEALDTEFKGLEKITKIELLQGEDNY